ncbi:DUF2125 domain-containing protein [Hellea balneolensis]|uniref:DUF2125 domain-containing protein n=1 Tax=Hellea balneolensis TaxID=287478 RepID=UPI002277345B|nr:DUF2125 domain-containing protein [Hellea balneolensis]
MSLFVLLCLYWALGRNIMIKSISNHISTLQSEGYKVVHKGLSVGGFPIKFRAGLAQLNIDSPRSAAKPWSVKGDDWQFEAISLNPLKWTGTHRGEARIDLRGPKGERWLFDARPFNVDMTARTNLKGELKSVEASASKLKMQAIIGTLPPIVAIDKARIDAGPSGPDMRYAVDLENIYLEKDTLKPFQKAFGPRIERLQGSALAIGLASLESSAVNEWAKVGQITGEGWSLLWGDTRFQGGFDLTQSPNGLSGIIRIEVEDINALISRLENAALLSNSQARNAKLAAILLPVNDSGRQEVTLTMRDGFLTLFGQRIYAL